MNCQDCQVALLAALARDGSGFVLGTVTGDLAAHLQDCTACSDAARRYAAQASAIAGLGRLDVPADLEGRVVAALQTGYREDRAIRGLTELSPLEAPPELDQLVHAVLGRQAAPAVLTRLVREDFEDPEGAGFTKRFIHKLARQRAPQSLAARVETQLVPGGARRRLVRITGLVAASLLATFVVTRVLQQPSDVAPAQAPNFSFNVTYLSSFEQAELEPGARLVVDALSSGVLQGSAH